MSSNTRVLLAACLLALVSVSSAAIIKRVIPTTPEGGKSNQKSLTILPINVAAKVGDTVVLTCEVAEAPPVSRVHWWEFVTNSNGQMISDNGVILPSHPNAQRYTITMDTPTTYNLQIHDLVLEDGGTYVCLDGNSGPPNTYSGQAELVILEADPNCTSLLPPDGSVMETQNYTISCEVNYGGNNHMAPAMTWTGPEPFLARTIPSLKDVFSAVTFTVDRSFENRGYTMHTNFSAPTNVPDGVASNAPEYDHFYFSGNMYVYWGPKNLYAVPIKPTYVLGDKIRCYADAWPSPFYQWANMRTLEVYSSQDYEILESDLGHNTTLRCQAQNLIQGFIYSANLFVQADAPAPTTTSTLPPTTTPPLESNCHNLTGWWRSDNPYSELHMRVPGDQSAQVLGFIRNHTDQQWVEVIGRTRIDTYDYVGLTAIWPYEIGVTGMAGECHRCSGVEVIFTGGMWRTSYDGEACGDGGAPSPHVTYTFHRVSDSLYDIHDPSFIVHKPSRHVSGRFGITHLTYE